MTDDEFKIFRDLIHNECGIFLGESKKDFLRIRIEKRLNALGIKSFFQYYRHIVDKDRDELYAFIESVTINETYFFRNMPQFEMFREKALPELLDRKRREKNYNLNIWSAGCATGEEPYSMAIVALEAVLDAHIWDIQIIASDISLKCLEAAQSGIYTKDKLKEVPGKYLGRYFTQSGDCYRVNEDVKRLVVFDFHNLKHENGLTGMDIIFCRNVMIYFDAEEQKRLVSRFEKMLNAGGYLFIGHAETLNGMANGDFRFIYHNKGTAYQKVKAYE